MLVAGTHTWVLCKGRWCQLLTAEPSLQMPNFYNNFHLHNFPDNKAHEMTSLDANTCCQEPSQQHRGEDKGYLFNTCCMSILNRWEKPLVSRADSFVTVRPSSRNEACLQSHPTPSSSFISSEPITSDRECSFLGVHRKTCSHQGLGGVTQWYFFYSRCWKHTTEA